MYTQVLFVYSVEIPTDFEIYKKLSVRSTELENTEMSAVITSLCSILMSVGVFVLVSAGEIYQKSKIYFPWKKTKNDS